MTDKIYTVSIGTPLGDHVFEISAKTAHAAAVQARSETRRIDPNLTDDHLTTHHLESRAWDTERQNVIEMASKKYGVKIVPTDIHGDPQQGLTIDGMDAVEWLETMFG